MINRGPAPATLHLLPTVWFRNTWSWGYGTPRPELSRFDTHTIGIQEQSLGEFKLWLEDAPPLLFTENESNTLRLWGYDSGQSYSKDAFHRYLIQGGANAVNPDETGTKACGVYRIELESWRIAKCCTSACTPATRPQPDFHQVFLDRIEEADDFYSFAPASLSDDARMVQRQAFAGLLWSKQFYHYVVDQWLKGDPAMPPPPPERLLGRNRQLDSRLQRRRAVDARQMGVPLVRRLGSGVPHHPVRAWLIRISPSTSSHCCCASGTNRPMDSFPAYEWEFSDVNPPVHPWACWRVFKIDWKLSGKPDSEFLESGLSQAADELHLVGEPQGLAGQQHFRRRISRPGQHRRLRSQQAAAHRRLHRASRRHGLDGHVLPDHAAHRDRVDAA